MVSAEVILKSESGRSLAKEDVSVTAANVAQFRPAARTVAEATRRLRDMGFEVSQAGVTLSIAGDPEQFERAFGIKLTLEERPSNSTLLVRPDRVPVIPAALKDGVEAVVFPEPPEFFDAT